VKFFIGTAFSQSLKVSNVICGEFFPGTTGIPWDSSGWVISPTQRPVPTQHTQEKDIHAPTGFESRIPASEPPQTDAIESAVTVIGGSNLTLHNIRLSCRHHYFTARKTCAFIIILTLKSKIAIESVSTASTSVSAA
jgi:hypothetical protein